MDAALVSPTGPTAHGLSHKSQILLGVTWTFASFAVLAVVLRLYLRRRLTQALTLDDWVMLLALAIHILFQTFLTLTGVSGFGYPTQSITIEETIEMTKWIYATEPANILANVTSRLSIAILLVQIFSVRKWFKWLIVGYTTIMSTLGLANFLFVFFQASPFQASWDFRIAANWRLPYFPHIVLIYIQQILFAIADLLYGCLPVFFIWKLNMPRREKIGLMIIMAGTLVTMAAAIGRVVITSDTLNMSTEVDADGMNPEKVFIIFGVTSILASVEVSLLIILGSLPKLRAITKLTLFGNISSSFASIFTKFWPESRSDFSTSKNNKDYAGSDLELNEAGGRIHSDPRQGYHLSSIGAGYNNSLRALGEEDHGDRIQVTDEYAVVYGYQSKQPKVYV